MFDWATLRVAWEPRMLSILRIMIGLLFLEHGTSKLLGFPPPANPRAYDLFTLNPGLQGPLELVGGLLIALGLFTRPVAFILAGDMAVAYFMSHAPRGFSRCSTAALPRSCIASFSSTFSSPAAASGASIGYGQAGRLAASPPGAGSDRADTQAPTNLTRGPPG